MSNNTNKFDILMKADLVKQVSAEGTKSYSVQGIASTVSKDRQNEKMSEKALRRMEEIATTKRIPVFSQHNHSWEESLGYINKSSIEEGQWKVDVALEDPEFNEKTAMLIKKMEHGTPIGFSIGGRVLSHYIDKEEDSITRVIDDLELLELSIVGIPANQDGSVITYIAKAIEVNKMAEDEKIVQEEVKEEVVEEKPVEEVPVEQENSEEAPVEEAPAEEQKEASFKAELEEFRKSLMKDIAAEISKISPVKKSVVVSQESTDKKIEQKELTGTEAVLAELEKRLK